MRSGHFMHVFVTEYNEYFSTETNSHHLFKMSKYLLKDIFKLPTDKEGIRLCKRAGERFSRL